MGTTSDSEENSDIWDILLTTLINIISFFSCCCCCLMACFEAEREREYNTLAERCKRAGHDTIVTTCDEEAKRDFMYRSGWRCRSCNRYTHYSKSTFFKCRSCNADFCQPCLHRSQRRGSIL